MIRKIIYLLIIMFIFFILIFLGLVYVQKNYNNSILNKYLDVSNQLNYFNMHKDDFNRISETFEKYEEMNLISSNDNKYICSATEKKIILSNKYFMCINNNITDEREKQIISIKKDLTNYLINIKEIKLISRKKVLNSNYEYTDSAISFYLLKSSNGKIHYNYCISNNECDSTKNYFQRDKGVFKKTNIDTKWSAIYDTTQL